MVENLQVFHHLFYHSIINMLIYGFSRFQHGLSTFKVMKLLTSQVINIMFIII